MSGPGGRWPGSPGCAGAWIALSRLSIPWRVGSRSMATASIKATFIGPIPYVAKKFREALPDTPAAPSIRVWAAACGLWRARTCRASRPPLPLFRKPGSRICGAVSVWLAPMPAAGTRRTSNCFARRRDRMLPKLRKERPSPPKRASGPATRPPIRSLPAEFCAVFRRMPPLPSPMTLCGICRGMASNPHTKSGGGAFRNNRCLFVTLLTASRRCLEMNSFFYRHARRILALGLIACLYLLARLPELSTSERSQLAAHFRFEKSVLPEVPGPEQRWVRPVNPSLRRIASWISSVGAAVALNDLDGDGLPNDVCYVDVRTDQVIVAPVPGTPARYQPFALSPAPLRFDRDTMAPMGCLPGDMDEDGRMDILVYYWGRSPIAFLRRGAQMNAAAFTPVEIDNRGERWFTNAATFADLDGDGHADLIVGNYFPDGSRILDAHATNQEHMQHSMSRAFNGGRKHLLRWVGPAQFREQTGVLSDEVSRGWTLAIGAADLDGDLLPEIYFANDFGPDRLLYNRSTPGHFRFELLHGERTLTVPRSKVLGNDSFKGMGVDFADLNGDGYPDIFVSNIAMKYALLESHFVFESTGHPELMKQGIAPYVDRSEPLR